MCIVRIGMMCVLVCVVCAVLIGLSVGVYVAFRYVCVDLYLCDLRVSMRV